MAPSIVLRYSLLALSLAPNACTFPVKAGDNPSDPSDEDPSDDDPTGGPAGPGVCGDGIVDDGEACDDGDGDVDDGCAADCTRTAALEWVFRTDVPWTANAVAVGPAGRIVVVGDGEVLALEPDGTEAWVKVMPADSHAFNSVAIDENGAIYLSGEVGTMHALAPNGDELWRSDVGHDYQGMALGHGAIYTVDRLEEASFTGFIARRHDRDTGAVSWATTSPDDLVAFPNHMTVSGPHIVVVGNGAGDDDDFAALVGTFDATGAIVAFTLGEPSHIWDGVAATPDEGVALVGRGGPDLVVDRLAADFTPKWSLDVPDGVPMAIASKQGGLAIAGFDDAGSFVRRVDPGGATLWTALIADDGVVGAVAFGPGFLIAVGNEHTKDEPEIWVRRYAD